MNNDLNKVFNEIVEKLTEKTEMEKDLKLDLLNNENLLKLLYKEFGVLNQAHESAWRQQRVFEQLPFTPRIKEALQEIAGLCLLMILKNEEA
jgi:hypothetical protein